MAGAQACDACDVGDLVLGVGAEMGQSTYDAGC